MTIDALNFELVVVYALLGLFNNASGSGGVDKRPVERRGYFGDDRGEGDLRSK
jgi:hypothetical protein